MLTIGGRIKKLRQDKHLTQQELADKIGVKRNTIANYEIGRNDPIDAIVSLICRTFDVNEIWLRTGEGEMYKKSNGILEKLKQELQLSEMEAEIIEIWLSFPEEQRRQVIEFAVNFKEKLASKVEVPLTIDEKVAIYRAELEAEEKEKEKEKSQALHNGKEGVA